MNNIEPRPKNRGSWYFFSLSQVQLCFLNGNHYDSVYPITRVKSAALCQCECLHWPVKFIRVPSEGSGRRGHTRARKQLAATARRACYHVLVLTHITT